MPFPAFYDPHTIGRLYAPDTAGAILAGHQAGVAPASDDARKVALILVDAQVDFIHTDGSLSVPGALDDTRRTIEWMFRNAGSITRIVASLDTHVPLQIFYPDWWINAQGDHPAPYTTITADEVDRGAWQPTVEADWSRVYVHHLEELGKKILIIWPYHTLIGTSGHAIVPPLFEAIAYHSAARGSVPIFLSKGSIPKTEHYSILEPEIKVPEEPLGDINEPLLEMLSAYDLIYVAGQAKSHCVLETVTSLYRYFAEREPRKIVGWRFLEDCTSSVVHPVIDFDAMANAQLARFKNEGMQMVKSTDPID